MVSGDHNVGIFQLKLQDASEHLFIAMALRLTDWRKLSDNRSA